MDANELVFHFNNIKKLISYLYANGSTILDLNGLGDLGPLGMWVWAQIFTLPSFSYVLDSYEPSFHILTLLPSDFSEMPKLPLMAPNGISDLFHYPFSLKFFGTTWGS